MLGGYIEEERLASLVRHFVKDKRIFETESGVAILKGLCSAWDRKLKRINPETFFDPSKNLRIR